MPLEASRLLEASDYRARTAKLMAIVAIRARLAALQAFDPAGTAAAADAASAADRIGASTSSARRGCRVVTAPEADRQG